MALPVNSLDDRGLDANRSVRSIARTDASRPAVEGPEPLTYGELDRQADRVAQGLTDRLGRAAHPVAIRFRSTRDFAIASLAIDRAGMFSVAVDPAAPAARVASILDDVGATILLTDFATGDDDPAWCCVDVASVAADVGPDGLAPVEHDRPAGSIVFTSGSTGVPKGIVFGAATKSSWGRWLRTTMPSSVRVGFLAVGTTSTVEVILQASLILGGTLVPYDIRTLGLAPMAAWLEDERIEGFACVPTVMRFFLPTLPPDLVFSHLRTVVMGGEMMTWEDVRDLRPHLRADAVVHNAYGTTESGLAAHYAIDSSVPLGTGPVPAGTPLTDVEVCVVDERGAVVAPGESGELVAISHEVGLGYWRRPDLSGKTFEPLPDGRRRCHTGDRARIAPDGLIELHGRLDHVIKVSGQRIELGEVETVLRTVDGVAAAAAAGRVDSDGNVRLCAYVVAARGVTLDELQLRAALVRRLPGYMQPYRITVLDDLPQLPNGKVDRSRLPEPRGDRDIAADDTRETGPIEDSLRRIWCEVLDLDAVGPDERFFDLGGDSMRAARLFAEIERQLGIRRPVAVLVEAPTVESLARALASAPVEGDILVPIRADGDRPPLFVIHGGGGEILWTRHMVASLAPDQPLYGFQPPPLDGPTSPKTLHALAAMYADVVTSLSRGAAPLLYGYSYGGVVALEIALQFQEQGRSVGLLAIGDTPLVRRDGFDPNPDAVAPRRSELSHLVRTSRPRAAMRAAQMAIRDPRSAVAFLRRYRKTPEWQRIVDRSHFDISRGLWRLVEDYTPRDTFHGDALLLRSDDHRESGDLGWSQVIDGHIEIVDIGGDHGALARPPRIDDVSAALTRATAVPAPVD
jgi:acyl-coenzyme A synthetase/AMP-(fatty) acid ligase/thioesterase domain-containing protein/acyl carrier protein